MMLGMAMKTGELVRILRKDGWVWVRSTGSHRQFRHPSKRGVVTVPYHASGRDLSAAIVKRDPQTGRNEMKTYLVVLEQAPDGGWGAYVPDLPGCASWGETRDEAAHNVKEAITGHIEALQEGGDPVPPPHCVAELVEVA